MAASTFIQDLSSLKNPGSIYPLAYGYLVGWLQLECNRTNNGQISRAEVLAKLEFIQLAIELAFDGLENGPRA